MTTAVVPRKRGRKPKGDRAQITAMVPAAHKPVLEQMARDEGLPLCDYVAVVLSEALGLPAPTYLEGAKDQEQLPLGA